MVELFRNYFAILLHPYRSHEFFRKGRLENLPYKKGEVRPLSFWAAVIFRSITGVILVLIEFFRLYNKGKEVEFSFEILESFSLIWIAWIVLFALVFFISQIFFSCLLIPIGRTVFQFVLRILGTEGDLKGPVKEIYYSSYSFDILKVILALILLPVGSGNILIFNFYDLGQIFFNILGGWFYIFVGLRANLNLSVIPSLSITLCSFIISIFLFVLFLGVSLLIPWVLYYFFMTNYLGHMAQ